MTHTHIRLAAVLVSACWGCGGTELDRVGITGTVMYEGEPLTGAEVMLRPERGPAASMTTDDTGSFVIHARYGPDSGRCEVRVVKMALPETAPGEEPAEFETNVLPGKFSEKPKVVVFESGQDTLHLNLDAWEG